MAHHDLDSRTYRDGWDRDRRDSRNRSDRGGDCTVVVHRLRQPLLVHLADRAGRIATGADLYLCDLAVCRLAASSVGGSIGADGHSVSVGTGSEGGYRRADADPALIWQTRSRLIT